MADRTLASLDPRRWPSLVGGAALAVTLAACGGSGSDTAPSVSLAPVAINTSPVTGTTRNADPSQMRIVLYAKTDQWYVQPFRNAPFTAISDDGSWSSSTHGWNRMLALLVDASYVPVDTSVRHPASATGVVAWDELPEKDGERIVEFAGRDWIVKTGDRAGPGPNYFSDADENLAVDDDGLHLRITQRDGRWYTAEVFLREGSLGYGTYAFTVASPLDRLDDNAVFSGFVYESAEREIDIEFSPFLAAPDGAQYVVQPYTREGNIRRFSISGAELTSHSFEWRPDRISFRSWAGDLADAGPTIAEWTYAGADIPPPGGEVMHFNLWLFGGNAPASGRGDHVVVTDFRFVP